MKLSELFIDYQGQDVEIKGLKLNSKEVEPGDLFICKKGIKVDRHNFIYDAINRGAVALLTEKDVDVNIPYHKVDSINDIEIDLYKKFYDNPQDKIKILGVTGTDGKTTTTTIIQTLIGINNCAYIGTNGYSYKDVHGDLDNTTPGAEVLYKLLREFVDNGIEYLSIEASSEGFFYHRLDKMLFALGILTNVDKEHMNTHKTLENYIDCKKQLFRQSEVKVLNSNDKYYNEFKNEFNDSYTYGYKASDDFYVKAYDVSPNKTEITFVYQNKENNIESPLLGIFNVENLAAAMLGLLKIGFKMEDLIKKIPELFVSGRMNSIDEGQDFYVVVDYAHTPNGLTKLFEFTNNLDVNRKIVVSGQAGERDATKRSTVGKIISDNNDLCIFTYEDPRHEPIDHILDMMVSEITKDNYLRINDRHEAIKYAIDNAKPNDLVMILGKGDEDGNYLGDEWVGVSDITDAHRCLKERLNKTNKL